MGSCTVNIHLHFFRFLNFVIILSFKFLTCFLMQCLHFTALITLTHTAVILCSALNYAVIKNGQKNYKLMHATAPGKILLLPQQYVTYKHYR